MSIGITQLIILIIIGILLFGNLPKIIKDVGSGIAALKKEVDTGGNSNNSTSGTLSQPSVEDNGVSNKVDTKEKPILPTASSNLQKQAQDKDRDIS